VRGPSGGCGQTEPNGPTLGRPQRDTPRNTAYDVCIRPLPVYTWRPAGEPKTLTLTEHPAGAVRALCTDAASAARMDAFAARLLLRL